MEIRRYSAVIKGHVTVVRVFAPNFARGSTPGSAINVQPKAFSVRAGILQGDRVRPRFLDEYTYEPRRAI